MSRKCCIATCPNGKQGLDRSVGYHPFPLDAQLRATWIEFIGGTPAQFQWHSKYVCSAHFLPSDLDEQAGLIEGAVPTIFMSEDMEGSDSDLLEELDVSKPSDKPIDLAMRVLFCRLCLRKRESDLLMPLSSKLQNTPLVEVIQIVTGIEITPSEQLPSNICGACLEKIDCSYNIHLEFKKYSGIVERIVEDQQLESHYKLYDEASYEAGFDANEEYLSNLMQKFSQEEEEIVLVGSGSPEPDDAPQVVEPSPPPKVVNKPAPGVYSWKEVYEAKPLRPYKCQFCPAEFTYPFTYQTHMNRHYGIKPNKCPHCESRFVDKQSLKVHIRTHTGETPYPCRHGCGESFPRIKARNTHERWSHGREAQSRRKRTAAPNSGKALVRVDPSSLPTEIQ